MSKVVSIIYNIGTVDERTVNIVYSKNVENEMLLMTTCLHKDNLGSYSIARSMSNLTRLDIIENSRVIDEAFLLTLAGDSQIPIDIDYVFYCYLNNIRFIYIPFTNRDVSVTLIGSSGNPIGDPIEIPTTVGFNKNTTNLQDISSIAGYVFVTETDQPLDNFGYRVHEIIDNPHRNLKESVLYSSEAEKYKHQDFLIEENGYFKDKRSKVFIADSFSTDL